MKTNRTKAIIHLIKIEDNAIEQLLNGNLTEEEKKRFLYKFNSVEYCFRELFRPYIGESSNFYKRVPNEVYYDYLEILKNLTPFQETLFSKYEKKYQKLIV